MAVEVVTGAVFSGKARYVRQEIARREAAGELGLAMLDWTALFTALFPGRLDAFRDDAVSDTGAPRMAGAVFNFAAGAILTREISGYLLTNSPERAIVLADRFDARLLEVDVDVGDLSTRVEGHMRVLRKTVARAARSAMLPRCRKAGASYFREQHRLVGRAHVVRQSGRGGYKVDPEVKKPFDRNLWLKGLTPKGKDAVSELASLGNPDPTPTAVLEFLLRNRVEG